MKVNNKVIIVTGGGNGMGRELVLSLLSRGAKVVAIDINEEALIETVAISKGDKAALLTYVVDITNRTSVENLYADILAKFNYIDGIINNAGIIQPFIKLNELSYEAIDRVFNVNFYGTLYMIKTFLPHLLTRPEAHIVNISSMGGFVPVPGQTIYGATKAAVKLMTEGLISELDGTNVNVTVVYPGAVNTGISGNSGIKKQSQSSANTKSIMVLSPAKAAKIIIDGMEQNLHRALVGKDSKMMDYFYRISPEYASKMIQKKMKGLLNNK